MSVSSQIDRQLEEGKLVVNGLLNRLIESCGVSRRGICPAVDCDRLMIYRSRQTPMLV